MNEDKNESKDEKDISENQAASFYNNFENYPQANITELGSIDNTQEMPSKSYRWDFNENEKNGDNTSSYPEYPAKVKTRKGKFIFIGAALIFVIAVAAFWFLTFSSGNAPYKTISSKDDPFAANSVSDGEENSISGDENSANDDIKSKFDRNKPESEVLPDDPDAGNAAQPPVSTPSDSGLKISESDSDEILHPTDIYKKVVPSIVGIQSYSTNEFNMGGGEGSGVIMSEDGYIITNAHVVADATVIKVILQDESSYEATVIGIDPQTDLAIIKIDASGLTPAEFGDSSKIQIGETVYPIGNPGGMVLASSMTSGMVSGINRILPQSGGYAIPLIQTDAAINPGNSGGALIDEYGKVIGITSSKIAGDNYEGLGFAIPIHEAKSVLDELMVNGRVTGRPMIGITYNPQIHVIDDITSRLHGLPTGVIVQSVNVKSDAYAKGLKANDIIHQIGDTIIASAEDMQKSIADYSAGDEITITVFRRVSVSSSDGEYLEITFDLMEQD